MDCGIEGGREVLVNKLNQEEMAGSTLSSQGSGPAIAAVVVSLLVVCSVIGCVIVVYYRRRLSVMKTDLANRTGQHNYCTDSTGPVNNQADPPDFSPENLANNPMYVVNFSPGNLDKNINITRQNISKIPIRETENIYQEPSDSLKN